MQSTILRLTAIASVLMLANCTILPSDYRGTPHFSEPGPPVNKIFVVEVPTDAKIESWKQLSSDPDPENKVLEKEGIDAKLKATDNSAVVLASASLQEQGFLAVITDSVQPINIGPDGTPASNEALEKIHATSGADAVFRFRITDLGAIPDITVKWVTIGTIGFVTSAVAIAYSNPATSKLIGVYLASEVVQEGAEAYFGYSLIDRYFRFVRVEAELIDTRTGKTIWQDASTCAGIGKLLEEYPSAVRDKTETQIAVALKRTLKELSISVKEAKGRVRTSN